MAQAPPMAAGAAGAAATAPAMSEQARSLEALNATERTLVEAEKVGLDTTRARQTFTVARNFHDMGKYSKAMQYCTTAEGYIE